MGLGVLDLGFGRRQLTTARGSSMQAEPAPQPSKNCERVVDLSEKLHAPAPPPAQNSERVVDSGPHPRLKRKSACTLDANGACTLDVAACRVM